MSIEYKYNSVDEIKINKLTPTEVCEIMDSCSYVGCGDYNSTMIKYGVHEDFYNEMLTYLGYSYLEEYRKNKETK